MVAKFKEKSNREKELDAEIDVQNHVMEKRKSANERELERYNKEARERAIERRVKWERAKRSKDIWKTTITKNNTRSLINDSILKDKAKFLRRGF